MVFSCTQKKAVDRVSRKDIYIGIKAESNRLPRRMTILSLVDSHVSEVLIGQFRSINSRYRLLYMKLKATINPFRWHKLQNRSDLRLPDLELGDHQKQMQVFSCHHKFAANQAL